MDKVRVEYGKHVSGDIFQKYKNQWILNEFCKKIIGA